VSALVPVHMTMLALNLVMFTCDVVKYASSTPRPEGGKTSVKEE
jgi:hypothetical protein